MESTYKLFKSYKEKIIGNMGNGPLYDDQINRYCSEHFQNFSGICSHDKFKPINNYCYVLNTGNQNSPGIHWIACYITNNNAYFFDSFHRDIRIIIKDIWKKIGNRNLVVSKNRIPLQHDDNACEANICGQLCIAWLHVLHDRGVRDAMLI